MASILKVDTIQDQSGNNIINENANTITIGASGDTITIPSGAMLTNNGTQTGLTLSDNILFNTASKGIYLGVTTATASNLLDDYEEGTWTPTVSSVSGFTNTNVDDDYSTYTKIGNLVNVRTYLQFPDSSGNVSITDYAYIGGLPFTAAVQDNAMIGAYRYNNGSNASAFVTTATINQIRWVCNYVTGSPTRNGGRVSINFFYITD